MCWWATVTALLYIAAVFIVLFYDTRAELSLAHHELQWWGYLRSWIKQTAMYRFVWQVLTLLWTLLCAVLGRMWTWLEHAVQPREPPDPHELRRRRYREQLLYHTRTMRPTSRRWARAMAAALALARFPRGYSFQHPDVQTLAHIIRPPPAPTLAQDYISGMSMLIHDAEVEAYNTTRIKFDTDSRILGMDSRSSASITDEDGDVVPGTMKLTTKKVKAFGGVFTGKVYSCTIRWTVLDKQSRPHTFLLPNSYYIPEGGMKLISPQHWSQELMKQDKRNAARPPKVVSDNKRMIMYWNNWESQLEVDIDEQSNVGNLSLAPGYQQYKLFLQAAGVEDEDKNPITMPPNEVTDDEQSLDGEHPDDRDWNDGWSDESEGDEAEQAAPRDIDFTLKPDDKATSETESIETDEEHMTHNQAAELLRIHHQFNHIGFAKLQQMAKCGIIPKRFSKCQVPVCSACMYGKATKRAWRHKPKQQRSGCQ